MNAVAAKQRYLFGVLELLLFALWHEVIQIAQLSLGEDAVHQFPDKHQCQHLKDRYTQGKGPRKVAFGL